MQASRTAAIFGGWRAYLWASLAIVVPCYWQTRLQASDLSSHVYNAWMAQLIERGHTDGLVIVRQWTNVLFDLILGGLFGLVGPDAAQRISVSIAVLVFVWGAFAFVSAAAGKRPWHLIPCITVLAYGWVFHSGFFNFYLSLGLCFWAMAAAWNLTRRRCILTTVLFAVAYLAHPLPIVWSAGLLVYTYVARRLSVPGRFLMGAGFVLCLLAIRVVTIRNLLTRWTPEQFTMISGLDQVWVFDTKYYIVMMGLLAVWVLLLSLCIRDSGARAFFTGVPFHITLLSAVGVAVLPTTVFIPGFAHSLSYIAERMSLGVAICLCAVLATARPRSLDRWCIALVTLIFFCFVYADERALNRFEDRMQNVIAELPPGQRVVSPITDTHMRVNALTHMIDRVCIGRCFSYANYEASTAQFRIRAVSRNPYVASTYAESWYLQTGAYVVQDRDLPMYKIVIAKDGSILVENLEAGRQCGSTSYRILAQLPPIS